MHDDGTLAIEIKVWRRSWDQAAPGHFCTTVIGEQDNVMSLSMAEFTDKQGQYLAFIYAYTKIHGRPPAEADMQRYFAVTPPTVHRMVIELERRQFIKRQPGRSRTIELLVQPEELPILR